MNIFKKDKEEPSKEEPKSKVSKSDLDVDKLVYNTRTKTVGIVRLPLERGEVKTDADGNVNADELEPYNPMKYPHQNDAKVAPSTKKEIESRELFKPFAQGSEAPAKDSTGDRAGNPAVNTAVRKKAQKMGITPAKLGKEEYQKKMAQAAVAALTDANFHSEARQLIADLEGKPEMAEKPDYPDVKDPKFAEKMKVINDKYNSVYSEPDSDAEDLGISAAQESSWDGQDALDSIAFDLKMNGFKNLAAKIQSVIKESKSTKLGKLLPESLINEGTRSQVGVIKGGKIISVYVHYDGYPSNMKDGLKKHMKDEKDVMTLIKKGGARGIYDDKEIEYYGNMKPMKGDVKNIDDYVRNAGNEASADYVYLYNTSDKKWYYAKTYDDTKLKKLF